MAESAVASIVLNDQTRTDLSSYGFRSWLLQDIEQPYEIIVNLFNNEEKVFEKLSAGGNPQCKVIIRKYPPAPVFNISAANNLGLHFATGRYVIFANADIIHTSNYLRRVTGEMAQRNLHYVIGTRCNLTTARTQELKPPAEYARQNNFDALSGIEFLRELPRGYGLSPWAISRETVRAVGAFDANVYCHEDEDLNDRAMHYLRRTGQQQVLYCLYDTVGYHLDHKASELHAMGPASMKIITPRRKRLLADPQSTEDTVPTPLDSLAELQTVLEKSSKPEIPLNKGLREIMPQPVRTALKRSKQTAKILWKGHS